jgi:hypothetical protein
MTPKTQAAMKTKRRRLTYNKLTGEVIGLSIGGGAQADLHGDAFLYARYYLEDADGTEIDPTTVYGCIDVYFTPRHGKRPWTVNLTTVDAYQAAVTEYVRCQAAGHDAGEHNAACEEILAKRDACVGYVKPE